MRPALRRLRVEQPAQRPGERRRGDPALGHDEDRVVAGDRADDAVEPRLIEQRGDRLRRARPRVDHDDRRALADPVTETRTRSVSL
jgi:hypothetical protein